MKIKKNLKINKIIIERKNQSLDKLAPLLNINKKAGSMLGYKH